MTSGFDIAHQYRTQAQKNEENETLSRLVDVLEAQAAGMKVMQKLMAWFAGGSLVVAIGSLAVAVLALVG